MTDGIETSLKQKGCMQQLGERKCKVPFGVADSLMGQCIHHTCTLYKKEKDIYYESRNIC